MDDDLEKELKELRLEARALARSGNPAVRAEGERALVEIEDDLRYLRQKRSKPDAQL